MHLKSAAGLVLVAGLASASPKAKRSQCAPNQCYSAVTSQGSLASEDCSSFLQTVVSQCPATTTVYTTSTFVAPTSFATITDVIEQTEIFTVTVTEETDVATIEDTVTFIQPTEVDVTNTIVSAVTVTVEPIEKRAYRTLPDSEATPQPVFRRLFTTSNCTATTSSATSIPSYASACSNSAQYSSACSKFGVSPATTTLSQSTSTITSTSTAFSTPVASITITAESDITEIQTVTEFDPVTFETTDATVIVQSGFTLTSEVVIPTTVGYSPPVCSGYQFVADNGNYVGQYVTAMDPSNPAIPDYADLEFGDASSAHNWVINSDGSVSDPNDFFTWYTSNGGPYYILEVTNSENTANLVEMACTVIPGGTNTLGAIGTLSCEINNTGKNFVTCPSVPVDLLFASDQEAANSGCQEVTLAVLPVTFAC